MIRNLLILSVVMAAICVGLLVCSAAEPIPLWSPNNTLGLAAAALIFGIGRIPGIGPGLAVFTTAWVAIGQPIAAGVLANYYVNELDSCGFLSATTPFDRLVAISRYEPPFRRLLNFVRMFGGEERPKSGGGRDW